MPGLTAVACERRQVGLVTLQLGLVGLDLGLVLVVVARRGRLGGGQLLVGLGQLGLVLADLLGVLAARRRGRPGPGAVLGLLGLVRAEGGLGGC